MYFGTAFSYFWTTFSYGIWEMSMYLKLVHLQVNVTFNLLTWILVRIIKAYRARRFFSYPLNKGWESDRHAHRPKFAKQYAPLSSKRAYKLKSSNSKCSIIDFILNDNGSAKDCRFEQMIWLICKRALTFMFAAAQTPTAVPTLEIIEYVLLLHQCLYINRLTSPRWIFSRPCIPGFKIRTSHGTTYTLLCSNSSDVFAYIPIVYLSILTTGHLAQVSLNSVQRFQRRIRKCLSQSALKLYRLDIF